MISGMLIVCLVKWLVNCLGVGRINLDFGFKNGYEFKNISCRC